LNFLRFGTLPNVEKVLQLHDVARYLKVQSLIDTLKSSHAVKYENQMTSLHQQRELGKVIERIEQINAASNEAKDISLEVIAYIAFLTKYELKADGISIYANIFMDNTSVYYKYVALLAYNLCKLGYAKQIAKRRYNETYKGINPHGCRDGLQVILLTN
jgi:hypothetical protein